MLKHNPIITFLKKHILLEKKSILLLLGISLISSSIVVVQPLLMQKLIDEAFIPKDIDALYTWGLLILVLGTLGIGISSFNQYRYTSLSTKLLFNFRTDIFEMIFFQQKTFFQKYKTGDLLSRLEGDITEIQRFATDSIFSITTAVLGMIGALSIMYMFDPVLASFCLILLPMEFLILKPLYPKMGEKTMAIRESTAFLGSFMIETLKHTLFFKTSNNINSRIKDLQGLQNHNRSKILDQQKLQIIFSQIPVIISLIGRAFLVFWGGLRVVNGQIEIGEFIAFLTYFGMILGPVQTLLGVLNNIPKVKVSLERLSILVPKVKEENAFKNIDIHPSITFKNVSFKYNANSEIFNNINIEIPYGQKITLLGENGVGKTTFLELLLNLIKPNKGTITLSNTSLNNIKPSVLYNLIGIVEQHPIILGTSLENNLRITKEDANTVELMEVIEKVGLISWFNKLPHGLETQLSESGQSLSGGQRQRIAIARLLLQKPEIILLDEHTSSLDYDTSIIIEDLIDELFKDSTRIIITHKQDHNNSLLYKIENKQISFIQGDSNV